MILVCSGHMKKINGLRAKILYKHFNSNVAVPFRVMVNEVMTVPSYSEAECCSDSIKTYSTVQLNTEKFNNDLKNLASAVAENLLDIPKCPKCKKSPKFTRNFGHQLLIEVIFDSF